MFFTRKKKWWLFACVFVFYIRPRSRNRGKEERVSVHRRTFMIGNLDCCRVRGRINLIHMAVRTYGDEIESWRSCAPVILNIQRGWRTKSLLSPICGCMLQGLQGVPPAAIITRLHPWDTGTKHVSLNDTWFL